MKKIKMIYQLNSSDCGLACLNMLFNYNGFNYNLYDLISEVRPSRDGLTLSQLKRISINNSFSFKSFRYKSVKDLKNNLPALLPSKDGHYVVVSEFKKNNFTIFDPSNGIKKFNFKQIKEFFLPVFCLVNIDKHSVDKNLKKTKTKKITSLFNFNKKDVISTIIITIILEFIVLFVPYLVKIIVNSINKSNIKTINFITLITISIFFIFLLNFLFTMIRQSLVLRMQTRAFKNIISKLYEKLFSIDLSFYETHSTGEIINRFNNIGTINNFLSSFMIKLVIDSLTGITCLIFMIIISPILSLLTVSIGILQGSLIYVLNNKLNVKTQKYIYDQSKAQSSMTDVFNNIIQVMSMGSQKAVYKSLKTEYFQSIDSFSKKNKINNLLQSWLESINLISSLLIYIVGFLLIRNENINIGTLIQFISLNGFVLSPITSAIGSLPQFKVINQIVVRLKEILLYKSVARNGNISISNIKNISLKNVSFSYNHNDKLDLKNISLSISRGQKIAIVGDSGGGKTTITKLIMNVFDDYKGNILVNDVDYKNLDSNSFYKRISVVTQTPLAINGTIKDNLDFDYKLSDKEIDHCLKNSEMQTFIKKLPLGINTLIGENGQNLSGGQKQRIAIARAISKHPDFIIFDEGTNSLDQLTENKIYNNLRNLNITQLIVSHRLSAIKDADCIYVLRNGLIVEKGTHNKLMNQKGLYYRNVISNDIIKGG
ncbi:peptidase domain-containing ABC transporter [Apilactobacillus xinyiensis]|uniref:peptidase domain-containing ABC transporter n=1 Tax=Apilactobacillus xinyiensis TaxID=2841032 RepID=UPI00200D0877|nr:peptidase domain-containing ABC transporter [Apilactobacillus xinyiensis]MCL0330812.1 peptidase domain-containing ABC transporter [Apilactobacillus xinyiensis]